MPSTNRLSAKFTDAKYRNILGDENAHPQKETAARRVVRTAASELLNARGYFTFVITIVPLALNMPPTP